MVDLLSCAMSALVVPNIAHSRAAAPGAVPACCRRQDRVHTRMLRSGPCGQMLEILAWRSAPKDDVAQCARAAANIKPPSILVAHRATPRTPALLDGSIVRRRAHRPHR